MLLNLIKDLKITETRFTTIQGPRFQNGGIWLVFGTKNPAKFVKVALIEGKNVVLMFLDM